MATDFGIKATTEPGYYFVSYNTEDSERIAEICRELVSEGLPIWYDDGIPHDSFWEGILAERINNCEEAIFFITKGIFEKGRTRKLTDIYTYREYNLARIYEKKTLIVFLDEINPKEDVKHDLMGWWQEIDPSIRQGLIEYDNDPIKIKRDILKALGFNVNNKYSINDDIKYPVFNSVTDHPIFGDEREFIHIRKCGDKDWKREIELEAGKQYEVEVFFRNDGNPEYNSSKHHNSTVAFLTRVSIDVPSYMSSNSNLATELTARIMWDPYRQKRKDSIALLNNSKKPLKLHYVVGQAKIINKWKANNRILASSLFNYSGTLIGLNELQGVIPAGDDYSGYIRFYIDVERDIDDESIEMIRQASLNGKDWNENNICAKVGECISLRTIIKNSATENLAGALYTEQIQDKLYINNGMKIYSNVFKNGYEINRNSFMDKGIEVGILSGGIIQITDMVKIGKEYHIGERVTLDCSLSFGNYSISKSLVLEIIE